MGGIASEGIFRPSLRHRCDLGIHRVAEKTYKGRRPIVRRTRLTDPAQRRL
jgi:hypothetical protein